VAVNLMPVAPWRAPLHLNAPGHMPAKETPAARRPGDETLPPNPVAYARNLPHGDRPLLEALEQWQEDIRRGGQSTSQTLAMTTRAIGTVQEGEAPLTAAQLYEIGRGVQFVDGPRLGNIWYRAVAAQAGTDLAKLDPKDEQHRAQAAPTLNALRFIGRELFSRCQDYHLDFGAAEQVYELLAKWEPPGSFAQRQAKQMHVESIYARCLSSPELADKACALSLKYFKEAEAEGLTPQERGNRHFGVGMVHYYAKRYDVAAEHFAAAGAVPRQYYTVKARGYALACKLHLKQLPATEAGVLYRQWQEQERPDAETCKVVRERFEDAVGKDEFQARMGQ
jgi:hypothetical protein